jgi:hypothetical protein
MPKDMAKVSVSTKLEQKITQLAVKMEVGIV